MPRIKLPIYTDTERWAKWMAGCIRASEATTTVRLQSKEESLFVECTIPVGSVTMGQAELDVIQGMVGIRQLRRGESWEWYVESVVDGGLMIVLWRKLGENETEPTEKEKRANGGR